MKKDKLTHLKQLEAESIYILREVASEFSNPVMMYSIGKDSSVMLHLAMKAFAPAKIPFKFLHVDTTWKFREMVKNNIVVYVKADIETCKKRDYKGVYQKALSGEIKNFTGISDVYEEPQHAEIVIDTNRVSVEEAIEVITKYVKENCVK